MKRALPYILLVATLGFLFQLFVAAPAKREAMRKAQQEETERAKQAAAVADFTAKPLVDPRGAVQLAPINTGSRLPDQDKVDEVFDKWREERKANGAD